MGMVLLGWSLVLGLPFRWLLGRRIVPGFARSLGLRHGIEKKDTEQKDHTEKTLFLEVGLEGLIDGCTFGLGHATFGVLRALLSLRERIDMQRFHSQNTTSCRFYLF
jgi:hypothetical protein